MPRAHPCFIAGQELMGLRQHFRLLDRERLWELLGGVRVKDFRRQYEALILERERGWTEAISMGSEAYVREWRMGSGAGNS